MVIDAKAYKKGYNRWTGEKTVRRKLDSLEINTGALL
jgi:hypothetical protein